MSALLDAPESGSSVRAMSRSSRCLLESTFDARQSDVPALRHIVRAHLQWWGVSKEAAERVLYAVNELLTNVVEHVTPDEQGRRITDLLVQQVPGGVTAVVRDEDPQRPVQVVAGPTSTSGRGLALVRAMVDELEVSKTGRGKDIWVFVADPASPESR